MNKTKLILPLVLIAPTLFACNKGNGITGNYVIKTEDISYEFKQGKESDYKEETDEIYLSIDELKTEIRDQLIAYSDGEATKDGAVHITNECPIPSVTKSGENITTRAVNYREKESDIAFEWGKAKDGYHFYSNHSSYVDNFQVAYERKNYIDRQTLDNGFTVKGNNLTAKFLATFRIGLDSEPTTNYQIEFTVNAKK